MKYLTRTIAIFAIFLILFTIPSYATSSLDFGTIKSQVEGFESRGNSGESLISTEDMNPLVSGLANILTTIGVVIVLAGLLIMGIKYMVATPDEAAKLKTKMVGLVIAGVVIIGAYGIWTLAINFFDGITNGGVSSGGGTGREWHCTGS